MIPLTWYKESLFTKSLCLLFFHVSPNKTSACRGESLLSGKHLGLRLILNSGGKGPYQFLQQLNKICDVPAYLDLNNSHANCWWASKHVAPKHTLTADFFSVCNREDCILAEEFISCSGLANELSRLAVLLKSYRSVCPKEAYSSKLTSALSSRELPHSDLICGGFLTCCGICLEAGLFSALGSAVSTWRSMVGWSVS